MLLFGEGRHRIDLPRGPHFSGDGSGDESGAAGRLAVWPWVSKNWGYYVGCL